MAITIAPDSRLIVTTKPTINEDPDIVAGTTDMGFTCTLPLVAKGEVTLLGGPSDSSDGWTVGFIQAQWIETNWAYYRGQKNEHGSIFVQRARPPSRPSQACRDCEFNAPPHSVFYNSAPGSGGIKRGWAGATLPQTFAVQHSDKPDAIFRLVEQNSRTRQPNYLAEAQVEYHFCTVLTAQDPHGKFHHQAAFYWNVRWQATFRPSDYARPTNDFDVKLSAKDSGAAVSNIIRGEPTDSRFIGVLTSPVSRNCKEIADAAVAAVDGRNANRHEATMWQNFDVRQP